jgi:hypothetical protein
MSQAHDLTSHDDASAAGGIHTEAAPFEPSYQPNSVPKISVPDLPHDALGLTAEALAQVPTLTEQVEEPMVTPSSVVVPHIQPEPAPAPETEAEDEAAMVPVAEATELEDPIQDTPVEADTWGEELQVRMGKLTDDIHALNARLDRLEEQNKAKA